MTEQTTYPNNTVAWIRQKDHGEWILAIVKDHTWVFMLATNDRITGSVSPVSAVAEVQVIERPARVVSPAEALYAEDHGGWGAPWADLPPDGRRGWEKAAAYLADLKNAKAEVREKIDNPAEVLPKGYERKAGGDIEITDPEGDSLLLGRMSSGTPFVRKCDPTFTPTREQFAQLVADLTPWMNGAES